MDLGEKLKYISNRIYAAAKDEFEASGVSPTLALVIIENVTSRITADAYASVNAQRAAEEAAEKAKKAAEAAQKREKEHEDKAEE